MSGLTDAGDRQAIDRSFNPRCTIDNVDALLARQSALGASVMERLKPVVAAYGDGQDERLLIFQTKTDAPVHLFFHGGFWRSGSAADYAYVAPPLLEHGIMTIIVDYPLCPAVNIEQIVACARAAIGWVGLNSGRFGGNSMRMTISGHSAGAHLAAMALSAPQSDGPGHVTGATLISGIYDLAPLANSWLQPVLDLDQGLVERNRPLDLPIPRCPVAVAVGALETPAFKLQSMAYAAHCGTGPIEIESRNHVDLLFDLAEGGPLSQGIVRQALA